MVMPLGDDDLDRRTVPVVTYALIAVNVIVWLLEIGLGEKFINGYSAVPFEITHNTDLVGMQTIQAGGQSIPLQLYSGPTPIYLTLLFSMFMHASWLHIGGNMLAGPGSHPGPGQLKPLSAREAEPRQLSEEKISRQPGKK